MVNDKMVNRFTPPPYEWVQHKEYQQIRSLLGGA